MPPILYGTVTRLDVFRATSITFFKSAFSAKGSRINAGRFNRENMSALYCSLDPDTALAEYYRGKVDRPCVLVPGTLDICNVVDLTGDLTATYSDWQESLTGDWKAAYGSLKAGDASSDFAGWRCGDYTVSMNCSAILFPSTEHAGGRNLAVYVEDCPLGAATFGVLDPEDEFRLHFAPKVNL